MVEILIYLDII